MAEYIDKKYLDRKFQIDMMALRGGTIFDTKEIIDSLPTADVIERAKIDKAIEEMDSIDLNEYADNTYQLVNKCIEILKRNIGENKEIE